MLLSGNMLVTAALNGLARDYTPRDKAGHFQGIRMLFAVLLPMVTGPYLGAAVIRGSGAVYEELGVMKQVPTPAIFLASAAVLVFVAVPVRVKGRQRRSEPLKELSPPGASGWTGRCPARVPGARSSPAARAAGPQPQRRRR